MRPALPLFACLLSCTSASTVADTFSTAIGMDYSSGDYGTGTTSEIWYVPVVGKYETGPMIYKVTVPWLRITNPEVGPNGDPLPGGCRDVESGLGDTVASAGYALLDGSDGGLMLDLIGKVKFPPPMKTSALAPVNTTTPPRSTSPRVLARSPASRHWAGRSSATRPTAILTTRYLSALASPCLWLQVLPRAPPTTGGRKWSRPVRRSRNSPCS